MEVDIRPKLPDDQMSESRSFGSNCYPSSQSRKVSIGIMIDSVAKKKSGTTEGDEIVVPNAERENFQQEYSAAAKDKGKVIIDANEGEQAKVPERVNSPWITTRSFRQETPITEAVAHEKETLNLPSTSRRRGKPSRAKDALVTNSVQFLANQAAVLRSSDGKQKKFDGVTYKRKGGKGDNSKTVEDFTFATAQEARVSDKVVVGAETEDARTETLRMKLWEVFGAVSSPKNQPSDSGEHGLGANNLKPGKILDQKGDPDVKPIHNSDTIETDSQSPDHTMKRPVTCYLARKRISTKVHPEKTKSGPTSSHRQKHGEKNIFSFEGLFEGGNVNGGSSTSTQKKGQRMTSIIGPHKICFPADNNADFIQDETRMPETSRPAQKTSSLGNTMGNFHDCPPPPPNTGEHQELKTTSQKDNSAKRDFDQSLSAHRKEQQENFKCPEDFHHSFSKDILDPLDDLQSPTFKINTPALSSSPSSMLKTDHIKHAVCSPPLAERSFTMRNIRGFRTLQTSKADSGASDVQKESPDDTAELSNSPSSKQSSDTRGSDSSGEGSPIISGAEENDAISPETETLGKPEFMVYPSKRLCKRKGNQYSKISPVLPFSPKGIGESACASEPQEESHEDELERVIMLFASALENFKNKMSIGAKKKSSKILMSVSEKIHLQLQNVESQIQTDLVKLANVNKSKRKHVETRFQEQQERLMLIHERFKKDIHQHLQDCKSILEGLEMQQTDLKGTVKKQKASHQKLLMQTEEAIQAQLNDAQRRVTDVHKLAREKMLQLKRAIAECLTDGILN